MGLALLHTHSEFSARDSLIRIGELPEAAARKGWRAVALTDHGCVEGTYLFRAACEKVGVHPMLGCELYIADGPKLHACHLTVIAKGPKGFSSLLGIISTAHEVGWNGQRKRASVPLETVLERLEDCVVLSGCANSPIWTPELNFDLFKRIAARFGEDFFVEVMPLYDWATQTQVNRMAVSWANQVGRPVVVASDCHFVEPDDAFFHEALLAVGSNAPIGSPAAWTFTTKLNYIMTPDEIEANLHATGLSPKEAHTAVGNTQQVAERVSAWDFDDLPKAELPKAPGDMRELARAEAMRRGLNEGVYGERFDREIKVFEKANLGPYLLLVKECLDLFRAEGAEIGPRGSVGGSLVANLLGLTNLDPIRHELPFERFYAPGRTNMPDVDLDVDDGFRKRVPDLLRAKYGEDRVAQLSTITRFRARSAVDRAAMAYGARADFPYDPEEDTAETIDDLAAGRFLEEYEPSAYRFATMLLDRVKSYSAHASAFVVSTSSLTCGRSCIVHRGKGLALCWDMNVAEALGFVKLDFLGNASLAAIRAVGEAIKVDWDGVPLDVPEVYTDFQEGRTAALPQFGTPGVRTLCEMIKPDVFADLVWAVAAYRPGGLGQMSPTEMAEAYRTDPDEIIVFQEDVMEFCVQLAGFTWTEADGVRKVVAKKLDLEVWRDRFVSGCVKRETLTKEEAGKFWDTLAGFAKYAFNKAHSTAYSWNAYRIAWAKRKAPAATYAALLNVDKDSTEALLDEMPDFNVEMLRPDVNHSGLTWVVEPEGVRAPLTHLEGADVRIAKAILLRRDGSDKRKGGGPFKDQEDFTKRMGKIKRPDSFDVAAFGMGWAEVAEVKKPSELANVREFREEVRACEKCDLRATCRAPVPPELNKTNIFVIGQAPGRQEDNRGKPFVGESGQLLEAVLEKYGIERRDVSWTNAVSCKPPGPEYDDDCPVMHDVMGTFRPPLVLAVGRPAFQKLGGVGGILKANAAAFGTDPKVVACVHPAAVLRDAKKLFGELERAVRKFSRLYKELAKPKEPE